MKFTIARLQSQLKCVWRLFWVAAPNLGTRFGAMLESIRLFKIHQNLRTPFWLQKELNRLIPLGASKVNPKIPADSVQSIDESVIEEYLSGLRLALIIHPIAACLERSIRTLQILHDKIGYNEDVHFKIGMRRSLDGFQGHAWIEYRGQPLLNIPMIGKEYGFLGQPLLDAPNLPVVLRQYDYIWNGNELIKALTQGVQEGGEYQIKDGLIVKQFGEEAVLLDLVDGTCFGLDAISYEVWKALTRTGTLEESICQIAKESGVDVGMIKVDIEELVKDLLDTGLIRERT